MDVVLLVIFGLLILDGPVFVCKWLQCVPIFLTDKQTLFLLFSMSVAVVHCCFSGLLTFLTFAGFLPNDNTCL